jgi:hypothetical protein
VIFSEFCRLIAVPVIALPPPSAGRKTGVNVESTRHPRSGGTALHGMRVTSPTRVGSETNKWWMALKHTETCFFLALPHAAPRLFAVKKFNISMEDKRTWRHDHQRCVGWPFVTRSRHFDVGLSNTCMHCSMWMCMHCIQLAMHVDMVYNSLIILVDYMVLSTGYHQMNAQTKLSNYRFSISRYRWYQPSMIQVPRKAVGISHGYF